MKRLLKIEGPIGTIVVILHHAKGIPTLFLPEFVSIAEYVLGNDTTLTVDGQDMRPHSFSGISGLKEGRARVEDRGVWLAFGEEGSRFLVVHRERPVAGRPNPSDYYSLYEDQFTDER